MQKKIYQLDYIKVFASFFVTAVHFRNRVQPLFQPEMVNNKVKLFFSLNYSLFVIAVPLFIITSGYLSKNLKYGKKLYTTLFQTYIKYFIIAQISYQVLVLIGIRDQYPISELIFRAMNFTLISGWYIELYISLMFIGPVLSTVVSKFSKKEIQNTIIFLLLSVSLPSFVNSIPYFNNYFYLPNFWPNIYPVVYFLIGLYIKKYENEIEIKKIYLQICVVAIVLFTTLLLYFSARPFTYTADGYYQSITQVFLSTSFFILLLRSKFLPKSKIVSKISKHTLSIYIFSLPVDRILYYKFEMILGSPVTMIYFSPLIVLIAYISVVIVGVVFDYIYFYLQSIFKIVIANIHKKVRSLD